MEWDEMSRSFLFAVFETEKKKIAQTVCRPCLLSIKQQPLSSRPWSTGFLFSTMVDRIFVLAISLISRFSLTVRLSLILCLPVYVSWIITGPDHHSFRVTFSSPSLRLFYSVNQIHFFLMNKQFYNDFLFGVTTNTTVSRTPKTYFIMNNR